ncbi:MAG: serine/threonine protein kinase [Planctomycetaceae bacterium]|nr:serine/threonine protein kinase [Planctomycetaceae bacterium]
MIQLRIRKQAPFRLPVCEVMQSEHEVFSEALTFTNAAERTAYLDRICGTDSVKRQRLNELLKLHDSGDSVLDRRPQEIIDSLNEGAESAELTQPQSLSVVLTTLRPYLEPPSQADSLGRLGNYELLEILGQGGYGIVFKALDAKLHRLVAIKILIPHLAATSPARRRFLREARAAAAVRHEHVVQIYAVEESPIPYLVMEFVSGETLQQRSDRLGPFDSLDVIRLGRQIARGLAAAHERGLIHRDIKPGNILIGDGIEPFAKLTDFGLARTADDASMSQSGVVIGTPMYMSPEQVGGEEVDQRTDLFSFGSVLYLMATGRAPFRATNTLAVLKRVAEDKPRSIRDVMPDVPEGLSAVISRLHAKSRDVRFSTAKDVEFALANCLIETPMTWRRRVSGVLSTRTGGLLITILAVLMAGAVCLLVGEASGLTHNFNRDRAVEIAKSDVVPAMPEPGSTKNGLTAAVEPEETHDKPVSKSVEQPVVPPTEVVQLTEWDKAVAIMAAEDQITTVRAKIKQLNPNVELSSIHMGIDDGVVRRFNVDPSDGLADITPVRALRGLIFFRLHGGGGAVSDLSPLKGLKLETFETEGQRFRDLSPLKGMPITTMGLWAWAGDDLSPLRGMALVNGNFGASRIRDLEPLRGMPIKMVCFNHSLVEDLSPLRGMPLERLEIQNTKVTDLTPISSSPLKYLGAQGSPIADLSPLKGSSLDGLTLDYNAVRDEATLKAMPELKTVNGRPLADFLAIP